MTRSVTCFLGRLLINVESAYEHAIRRKGINSNVYMVNTAGSFKSHQQSTVLVETIQLAKVGAFL